MDYETWLQKNKQWLAEKFARCDNPREIERVLEGLFAIWSAELSRQLSLVGEINTLIARTDNLQNLPAPASATGDELEQ